MKKTRKNYEDYLNDIYNIDEGLDVGEYMLPQAKRLLMSGKYGSALRKYDPVAFNVGFNEWQPNRF